MPKVLAICMIALTLALCMAFVRLCRGPGLPDRVVALELFSSITVGFVGMLSIVTDESLLLDVAIVMALMGFLATIGFARFLERGGRRDD